MSRATRSSIRVLIVDDFAAVRTGLRLLVQSDPNIVVVGEATDEQEALALTEREHPDVILLRFDVGSERELELLSELQSHNSARVLVLLGANNHDTQLQVIQRGARGIVPRSHDAPALLKAIEKIHAGEIWLDRASATAVLESLTRLREDAGEGDGPRIATLTQRERSVIALVCQGLQNKQIAAQLCISDTTVRHHLTAIFAKLGLGNRLELVIFAYRNGLAAPVE